MTESALHPAHARLARLTAAVVLGQWEALATLRQEAPEGEPDRAWREALLQSHLFAGYPRVVEAFEVLSTHGGTLEPPSDELESRGDVSRGQALFDRIYCDLSDPVRDRLSSFHPDFADWIAEHAYGRVLSRPGLEPRVRELCAVVALAVSGQTRQQASHVRGAMRLGCTLQELREALEHVSDLADAAHMRAAQTCLRRFANE